jgi:hypothetical protein
MVQGVGSTPTQGPIAASAASCKPISAMQMEKQKPVSGKMENKFPYLYNNRQSVMLSSYELSMVIMGMKEELKLWERLLKNSNTDEEQYGLLEIKLHRSELLKRLEEMSKSLFPLPF